MKDLNTTFRPKSWNAIKGQDKIVSILKTQILSNSGLANSYIFAGKSGVGKTTMARLFFMALNCNDVSKTGDPCLKCQNCKDMQFQLLEVNASNSRGIDDMRELIKHMHYVALGKYKGVLLDEVHMLSKPAWNCLLKPLEETSDNNVWIMCTTELYGVPKTIQTRCQLYRLNQIRWSDIFSRVKEVSKEIKASITDDNIWKIARNADNNIRQAIHLLEQYSVVKDIDKILSDETNIDFLNSLVINDLKGIWLVFSSWEKKYGNIDIFLNSLKYDITVCLKMKLNLPITNLNPYRAKKYKEFLPKISLEKLMQVSEIILEIQQKISGIWDYNSLFLKALCKINNIQKTG